MKSWVPETANPAFLIDKTKYSLLLVESVDPLGQIVSVAPLPSGRRVGGCAE